MLESLWSTTSRLPRFPPLEEDVEVDVAIVGAGITGVSVAHLLAGAGKRVALLELGRIGQGTTGHTTAKLTVGQSLLYARLRSAHGPEAARLYAESNQDAIAQMRELASRAGIECDWEQSSNYVYTESSGRLDALEHELAAMRDAGIAAELTRRTDLPFPVAGAIRVDDQAQFHPLKYLAGLVSGLPGDGSHVFEATRATGVRSAEACVVETTGGRVRADHVVVATQLPFLDRGLFFAKAHPQKSYAVAAEVDRAIAPMGMYISIDEPTRSIRSAPATGESRYVIVGGESQRPGEEGERPYRALEGFLREHLAAEGELRWSAHDYMPADGLPYIGRLRRRDARIYVATGFAKWGLTKATIAARIIADAILGRPNRWAQLYDAGRLTPRASARALAAENASRGGSPGIVSVLDPERRSSSASRPAKGRSCASAAGSSPSTGTTPEPGMSCLRAVRTSAASSAGTAPIGPGNAPATARASPPKAGLFRGPRHGISSHVTCRRAGRPRARTNWARCARCSRSTWP
jgi:glycine/D-amino acid oxidase-like deaminating enzyme